MTEKITNILLAGPPKIGKTTIIKSIVEMMKKHEVPIAGFYTEEISQENGRRIGFDVVGFDGKRAILARQSPEDNGDRPIVGKYFVYVKEFEELALPSMVVAPKTLLIIDEVGKMELLSKLFEERLTELFGTTPILATVPLERFKTDSIVEKMKTDKKTVILEVTKKNRNTFVDHIFGRASQMLWD